MPKQVKTVAPEAAHQPGADNSTQSQQKLYVSVKTFDAEGRTVGERIVDMHHFGTRNWLQNHLWWSTHHNHCTEVNIATPEEVDAYVNAGAKALATKLNADGAQEKAA
jgi:hypothetical protein